MIQANELRIGNLVRYKKNNKSCNVLEISKEEIKVSGLHHECLLYLTEFEPIPLAPEWLERAKNLDNFVFVSGSLVILGETFDYNGLWVGKIDYVHQLQNLYFAHNGKELEFNLDNLN